MNKKPKDQKQVMISFRLPRREVAMIPKENRSAWLRHAIRNELQKAMVVE